MSVHIKYSLFTLGLPPQQLCMYIKHKVLTLKTYFPSALVKKNLYSLFLDLSSPTESLISISRLLRCCMGRMGVNEREHMQDQACITLLAGNCV